MCEDPKKLRIAVYEFGNYLCDKRKKWLGGEKLLFGSNNKLRKNGVTQPERESAKQLRHRLLFATIERKIQFDFIKKVAVSACV